jgi:hypothetical protein
MERFIFPKVYFLPPENRKWKMDLWTKRGNGKWSFGPKNGKWENGFIPIKYFESELLPCDSDIFEELFCSQLLCFRDNISTSEAFASSCMLLYFLRAIAKMLEWRKFSFPRESS